MKYRKVSLAFALLLSACADDQSGHLGHLPYDMARGICRTSSHCTGLDSGMAGPREPDHWYEDGSGRDERSLRH